MSHNTNNSLCEHRNGNFFRREAPFKIFKLENEHSKNLHLSENLQCDEKEGPIEICVGMQPAFQKVLISRRQVINLSRNFEQRIRMRTELIEHVLYGLHTRIDGFVRSMPISEEPLFAAPDPV